MYVFSEWAYHFPAYILLSSQEKVVAPRAAHEPKASLGGRKEGCKSEDQAEI
jgi:hypothetical protein